MEDKIFPEPAVAGVLTREFVEARIHTDHPEDEKRERNRAKQDELQGSRTTPYYVLVDPVSGKVVGTSVFLFDVPKFRDFLEEGIETKRERRTVATR